MAISQNKIFLVLLCLIGVFAGTPALAGSNTAPSGEPFPKPSKHGRLRCEVDRPCGWSFRSLVATITTIRRLLQEARRTGIDCHNAFTEILISKEPRKPSRFL
uniref:Uncharacterized protein n=1 Tax=Salix viminalis TaxID=40686 RepID=A0A6N2N4X1_SALVM